MKRRWIVLVIFAIALAAFVLWRATSATSPSPPPATVATTRKPPPVRPPQAAKKAPKPSPLQLEKPIVVRPAPPAAPGALEGTVVDAESGSGIAGAVLTFSHDDGAYETASGPGGGFRFAPRAAGLYRLIAIEAWGYVPFEGEFGRSPVSFTSVAGKDVGGVVLRLVPEGRSGPAANSARAQQVAADAGSPGAPQATGALRGRVLDGRTGAPVAAFAVVLWRREGIAASEMVAPASFIDPSGAYQIDGLAPGTYEASAMAAGYAASGYALAEIADAPVEADFALHAGARVRGVVRDDATNAAVAGAAVFLEGRRGGAPDLPAAPSSPETRTGPDGSFALVHVPPDAISLRVDKEGYLSRLVSLGALPEDGDGPSFVIRLTRPDPGADASVELTGIGAVLRAAADALEIQQVVPNAGAAEAGLGPGDQIVAIDGAPVSKLGFEPAIGAIRGPEGSTVTLRIRRAGSEMDVIVTRKRVRG